MHCFDDEQLAVFVSSCSVITHFSSCPQSLIYGVVVALALSLEHFIPASGEVSGMTKTGFSEVVLGQTCADMCPWYLPFFHTDSKMTYVVGDTAHCTVVAFRFSSCTLGLFWKVKNLSRDHIRK